MDDTEQNSGIDAHSVADQHLVRDHRVTWAMLIVTCLEAALFSGAVLQLFNPIVLLTVHLGIAICLAFALQRQIRSGSDGGIALMGLLGTLATGPFGAACTVLLPSLARADRASSARLGAWYDRIALSSEQDGFTRTSDSIAISRTANLAALAPANLMRGFRDGGTALQQAALGMIARNFHPDYLPVLKIALTSPEPVVRVQAAAVAARVRDILKREIEPMIARAAELELRDDPALMLAADLEACALSGLLEESPRRRALRASIGIRARTFARLDAKNRDTGEYELAQTTAAVSQDYLAHLLASGRFSDFRSARARGHLPVSGRYRRRLVELGTRKVGFVRPNTRLPTQKPKTITW